MANSPETTGPFNPNWLEAYNLYNRGEITEDQIESIAIQQPAEQGEA